MDFSLLIVDRRDDPAQKAPFKVPPKLHEKLPLPPLTFTLHISKKGSLQGLSTQGEQERLPVPCRMPELGCLLLLGAQPWWDMASSGCLDDYSLW